MNDSKSRNRTLTFENAVELKEEEPFVLQLYVTGATERSLQAIAALKKICSEELKGRCEVEVFDLYKNPELAREAEIVVIPTLIKKLPLPMRRLIGDLSDKEKVLQGLGVKPRSS